MSEDQLLTLLEAKAIDLEAPWLLLFAPSGRPYDSELELFKLVRGMPLTYEDLSPSSPTGVQVYEGAYAVRGAGMAGDGFARGVAAVATLVDLDQASQLADFLNQILERVDLIGAYPAVSERLVERYSATALAILENGEPIGLREQLAFNLGAWWLVGHLKQAHKVRVGAPGKPRSMVIAFIDEALTERAKLGTVYA